MIVGVTVSLLVVVNGVAEGVVVGLEVGEEDHTKGYFLVLRS